MSIPGFLDAQRDFSAGQLDLTAIRRDDTDIVKAGARQLLNCEINLAGGFRRRPGSDLKFFGGPYIARIQPEPETFFNVEFRDSEFRAIDDDGNLQVVAAPWNGSQVSRLEWELYDNKLFVCVHGGNLIPQVVEYDVDAGTWSIRDFAFTVGTNGMLRQPFYRFAEKGITMQPGDRTNGASHTVTFSDNVLKAAMEGLEFRWGGRRLRLDTYTSPTEGDFTNIEELPICRRFTLDDTSGYREGDAFETFTTGIKGFIVSIVSATQVDVIQTERYEQPTEEQMVAPTAANKITTSSIISPLAVTYWDESFVNDVRKWPGSVSADRQRLIFCDFHQLPGAILESEIGDPEAFDVADSLSGSSADTVDPSSAIFEITPKRERVFYVAGGPDQFVFTEGAIYYVPISESNPLQPGSLVFREIGSGGCARVKPVATSSAIVYFSDDNQRVMAVRATGQPASPYILAHISRYHAGLINNPVDLHVSYGQTVDSGETLIIVNSDGTVVVGRYSQSSDFVGFVPWTTNGLYKRVAAQGRIVLFGVERTLDGATTNIVEQVSYDRRLDCVVETADASGGADLIPFANTDLTRIVNGLYLGQETPDGTGFAAVDAYAAVAEWGFNFEPTMAPFAPNYAGGDDFAQRMRRRKIKKGAITFKDSGPFRIGTKDVNGYRVGDDISLPPPFRSNTEAFRVEGRSYDPTFTLIQAEPYPLEILEIAMEMTS